MLATGGARYLLATWHHDNLPTNKLLLGPARPQGLPLTKASETEDSYVLGDIDDLHGGSSQWARHMTGE